MWKISKILSAIALAWCAVSAPVSAQTIEGGTVKLIVPYAPGGSVDFTGRLIAEKLSGKWNADVIVENIPGASGILGSRELVKAKPDGRTLIIVTPTHALSPLLYTQVPYDNLEDFSPIAKLTDQGSLLIASTDSEYETAEDLLVALAANKAPIKIGTPGAGSSAHLSSELIRYMTGSDLEPVHFKGGSEVLVAVAGGHLPLGIGGVTGPIDHIAAGNVRGLAVTSPKRDIALPDVPTLAEAGLKGYETSVWKGILGPKNMDPALVQFINDSLRSVLADPDSMERFRTVGIVPDVSSPQEFDQIIRDEIVRWKPVIEGAGLTKK